MNELFSVEEEGNKHKAAKDDDDISELYKRELFEEAKLTKARSTFLQNINTNH